MTFLRVLLCVHMLDVSTQKRSRTRYMHVETVQYIYVGNACVRFITKTLVIKTGSQYNTTPMQG